jgi:hypothetical protein
MMHELLIAKSSRLRRALPQLIVVVPTILASLALSQRGVPPLRRLVTSAALGIILIALTAAWRLIQRPRSRRQ